MSQRHGMLSAPRLRRSLTLQLWSIKVETGLITPSISLKRETAVTSVCPSRDVEAKLYSSVPFHAVRKLHCILAVIVLKANTVSLPLPIALLFDAIITGSQSG